LISGALIGLVMQLVHAQPAAEVWFPISNFESNPRIWTAEQGPVPSVRPTEAESHSSPRSLAVTLLRSDGGRMVRATWGPEVSDLRWSLDSRIRCWIKGSKLARKPHGGIILVEAGGMANGGPSHWILEIPGETYSDLEWHLFTSPPLREATNPDWAPDADGKLNPERIVRLVFVGQQDAPETPNVPFTFYLDDVEASQVSERLMVRTPATVEEKPSHVTPIWRGFQGRKREHPAQVTFGDVTGWYAEHPEGSTVAMARSEEEPCHEDLKYQAKVTYSAREGAGYFELRPPQPLPIKGRFNAVCAWVYGNNWSWVPDPKTPPVDLWARVVDSAGQRHRMDLGVANFKFYGMLQKRLGDDPHSDAGHLFWGGPADGRIHFPAQFEALEVHGATNVESRTIYVESVALYQDDMPLPTFRPELIEKLPFPTTPDTILPSVEQPTKVTLAQDGTAWVFTLAGDERIVYRYEPRTGTLSDLTVKVGDRPPFTPCAGAGPVLKLGGEEHEPTAESLTRKLVRVSRKGEGIEARWQCSVSGDKTEFTLGLRAKGKSLIVDWASAEAKATALRLGRAEGLQQPKLIRVPYLCIYRAGPSVLLDRDVFFLTLLDWYKTNCSAFYTGSATEGTAATVNGGSEYGTLTDGTRNPLRERQFITVSSRFEEVLPNIPNPPSTQAEVTRDYLYCHIGGIAPNRFDTYLTMWRSFKRHGIEKVRVSHHEDSWTNGADVGQGGQEYTMCIEAAPEVGDEKLIAYCRAMREMGYYIGLYENFTDYNPLGKSWDERNAARNSAGEMMRVWPPTYAIRPLKALEMALDYPRRVHAKVGTNTAYRDCSTAYPPWGQVDFQAGTPGAGKFSTNFRAWGALLMDGHKAYGGPIFSEGTHHWFSAGLVDGNYAQMGIPDETNYPLLLDFDLRKLHPLEADISMTPGPGWGRGIWQGQAATIAYGHIGFQPFGDLTEAGRYYYLMQQLQSRYTMVPVQEILYHRDGKFVGISEALKTDAHSASQVLVRYRNGLEVAVNCHPKERWRVKVGAKEHDLSTDGWAAGQGEEFEEYSTVLDGRRIGFVRSPAYWFADGGGQVRDFGSIATDGAVAVRPKDADGFKVIVFPPLTSITVQHPTATTAEAFDGAGNSLGRAPVERTGERVTLPVQPRAEWYVLR
jgi:hypothetical protein